MWRFLSGFFGRRDDSAPEEQGSVTSIEGIQYGSIEEIGGVDWKDYGAGRGAMAKEALISIIPILLDESGAFTEDERSDAANEGLWDWLCHQGTLYPATPLFLDHLLSFHREELWKNRDLVRFLEVCRECGTRNIWLREQDVIESREGRLPIFRIEDVLEKHGVLSP
jgi:hypothetical protein